MFNLKAVLGKLIGSDSFKHDEAWEVMTRQEGDQTLVGLVDLAAIGRCEGHELQPVTCKLDWQSQSVVRDMTGRVQALEGQLIDIVRQTGGEYLGRLGFEGQQRLFLAVKPEADDLHRKVGDASGAAGFALNWQPFDQSVKEFVATIMPDRAEKRRLADLTVLAQLIDLNDDLSQPRPVEHRLYFPERADAKACSLHASSLGYVPDPIIAEAREFCLILRHNSSVTEAAICPHTISLEALASEMGGDYDGWETEVRPKAA